MKRAPLYVSFGGCLLTAIAMSVSTPALADVCQKVRPSWDAAGGPMTVWGEASYLLFSPGGVMLLLMIPLAMRFQKFWFSIVVAGSALLVASLRYYQTIQPVGIDVDAIKQGCIGNPVLGIFALLALALLVVSWQFFGPKREVTP